LSPAYPAAKTNPENTGPVKVKFKVKVNPFRKISAVHYKRGVYFLRVKKPRIAIGEFTRAIVPTKDSSMAYAARNTMIGTPGTISTGPCVIDCTTRENTLMINLQTRSYSA